MATPSRAYALPVPRAGQGRSTDDHLPHVSLSDGRARTRMPVAARAPSRAASLRHVGPSRSRCAAGPGAGIWQCQCATVTVTVARPDATDSETERLGLGDDLSVSGTSKEISSFFLSLLRLRLSSFCLWSCLGERFGFRVRRAAHASLAVNTVTETHQPRHSGEST
jgi:hypothetical protein